MLQDKLYIIGKTNLQTNNMNNIYTPSKTILQVYKMGIYSSDSKGFDVKFKALQALQNTVSTIKSLQSIQNVK